MKYFTNKSFKSLLASVFLFSGVYLWALILLPSPVMAGPLYDRYLELKAGYQQFFDRLLTPPGKYNLTDQQVQNWLEDVDNYLASRNKVINSTNFSGSLTDAIIAMLFYARNSAVYNAVWDEYGQDINNFMDYYVLSEDLLGFYNAVKTIELSHVVVASPPPAPLPQTYTGPLAVGFSGFITGTSFYYTTDGSAPITGDPAVIAPGSILYTAAAPINVGLAGGSKTIKAVACKRNPSSGVYYFSDVYNYTYDVARGSFQEKIGLEATGQGNVTAYMLLDDEQIPVPSDGQGNYSLNAVPAGERTFYYSAAGYLTKKIQVQVYSGQVTVGPQVVLRAGDLNGDNKNDLCDLEILAGSYGSRRNAGAYISAADINQDGFVDLTDVGWLASNYGFAGD